MPVPLVIIAPIPVGGGDPNIFDGPKQKNEAFYHKDDGSGGEVYYIFPPCGSLGNELFSYNLDARSEDEIKKE